MDISLIFTAVALFVATGANLTGKLMKKSKLASIAKVFLIPLIILLCYIINPEMNMLVYIGLVFGWLGDIFLISPKKPMFMAGLSAFLVGHVLYIIAIAGNFSALNIMTTSVLALLMLAVAKVAYSSLEAYIPKDMKIPVAFYVLTLSGINFVSINLLLQSVTAQGILLVVGTALFLASDYVLARGMFKGESKLDGFVVMATYIPAQLLIALSFAL